jgi:hypothetical protein
MDASTHRASETMRAVWYVYLASECACMHRAPETMRAAWCLCTALRTGEHACMHRASTSMTAVWCLYIPCQGHAGMLQLGLPSGLASHEASECMCVAQGDGCGPSRPCQGHAGRLQLGLASGLASHEASECMAHCVQRRGIDAGRAGHPRAMQAGYS